ncbi:hypothetical protein GMOD_00002215 [Pyrenophora seminiperda CCB06]|uniref:DUS-like FMN-binding domain-containing protein n=1 Tax=Pyrenophora seminiperda CCB06 TaxID=1302712 RepID=A0A3M7LXI1_9PLEO|nr:hypothetical protein GMOD_00002215 [Pyrenophora seminiperda CCB06]
MHTMASNEPVRVPIPKNGVDYRGKVVLAPMVRSGELPSRLLALKYGADLVWGPETIDRAMIGTTRRLNPHTSTIEFSRLPTSKIKNPTLDPENRESVLYRIHPDLVEEVGKPYEIGISVKVRILDTPEETEALVRRLVRTGITGLTVHCRTTPMRPRERAIRHQLKMIGQICREAGVACVMNGDVTSRTEALKLMEEFGVDGAMIATEAEKNPSCFRPDAEGGPHEWRSQWKTVVTEYMRFALQVENRWGNTKYLLSQMIPGKEKAYALMNKSKCYSDVIKALGLDGVDDLLEKANTVDQHLGIPQTESRASKRARIKDGAQPEDDAEAPREKRKEREDEQPDAKRIKVPESMPEMNSVHPSQETLAPAALSV